MSAFDKQTGAVLALDIGAVNTRGFLFDIGAGGYQLVASATALSSHAAPNLDIGDAIFEVVSLLQEETGRVLMNANSMLIIPARATGEGVNYFFITASCLPTLKMVAVGLLNEISLESAKKLALSTYGQLLDAVGISDGRPVDVQMDAILASRPDLILFAGGTENGVNRSLIRTTDMLCGALGALPRDSRPQVLYCGNQALAADLSEAIARYTDVHVAPNIRPSLEKEALEPAMKVIDSLVMKKANQEIGGLLRISPLCSLPPQPENSAFHQVIKFLGRQYDPEKGVLGLDIGASSSVAVYANDRVSTQNTFNLGMGSGMEEVITRAGIREITRWLTGRVHEDEVSDTLWNWSLFPQMVATTTAELEIEMAAARLLIQLIMQDLGQRGALPSAYYEPILLSGSIFNRAPSAKQTLRVILDGVQPLGITPLILDKHGLLPTLGTASAINPMLSVQLLDSNAFTSLATVVTVLSRARQGTTLLSAHLEYEDGSVVEAEVKQGALTALPLPAGAAGKLHLRAAKRVEVEETVFGAGPVRVRGGVCGLVFDARGRPLQLPDAADARIKLLEEWDSFAC